MELYERIKNLCNEKGIRIAQMCSEAGLRNQNIITELKMGRSKRLSSVTLSKIATYFGVSVDYLLGIAESTEPMKEDGLSEQEKTLIQMFRETTEEGRMEMIAAIVNVRNRMAEKKSAGSNTSFVG